MPAMRALRPILLIALLLSVESRAAWSMPVDGPREPAAIERGDAVLPVAPQPDIDGGPGDAAAQFRLGRDLFRGRHVPRDRARGYAQMRLAAMAGFPGAQQALAKMRRRISIADRVRAVAILTAFLVPPPDGADAVPRLSAAWLPDGDGQSDALARLRPSPAMIRVAAMPERHAVRRPQLSGASRPAGWSVQLGAFRVAGAAERHWTALGGRVEGLAARRPRIALMNGVTRLRLTGLDRAAAATLCADIVAHGSACFAIAPRPIAPAPAGAIARLPDRRRAA